MNFGSKKSVKNSAKKKDIPARIVMYPNMLMLKVSDSQYSKLIIHC